ncbi:MAG: hypothetical protein M3Y72_08400 [Acidobacteriota bacterium]|nr:hypothetical protein [Acidobacteriota bacterium]
MAWRKFIADGQPSGVVQPVPGLSERLGAEVQQANQAYGLTLITENRKHFPMPELSFYL